MAEGEFALGRHHLQLGLGKSVAERGAMAGDHDVLTMLVDAAALERDEAGIRKDAPRAEELALHASHSLYTAIVHRAWGVAHTLAGEFDQAESRFTQALELFRNLETRWQTGRCLYELGELERGQGNPTSARDYYRQALTAFAEMGAAPFELRVQERLASLS